MAASMGKAVVEVEGDYSQLQQETERHVKGPLAGAFGVAAGVLSANVVQAGIGAVSDFFKGAVGQASDLNEAINVTGLVFGDAAKGMDTFFQSAATGLGMSEAAARGAAANVGSLLGNLGFNANDAAKATETLIQRAADLGSAFNADPEEVVGALGAALRGETEPARRFGIMLDDAAIKAKAMAMGLYDGKGAIDKNAKAQAALALVMEQSNKVAGDFAKTSGGQANSARILSAEWKDFQAQMGQALLPALTAVMGAMKKLLPVLESFGKWLSDHTDVLAAFAIGVAAVGIAIGATMVPAFIAWAGAALAAAAATLLALAPFIAIGAAVAIVAYVIIKNWDTIRDVTIAVWDAITGAISAAFDFIKQWAPVVMRILMAIWTGGMSELVRLVINNWSTIVDFIRGIPGKITGALGSLGSLLAGFGRDLIFGFLGGITSAWSAVSSWVSGIAGRVLDGIGNLGSTLYGAGRDVISGFIRGLESMAGSVVSAISRTITDRLPGFVKSALGIHSPSTVFAGLGAATMQGFAVGIERSGHLPVRALAAVQRQLNVAAATRLAAGATGLAGAGAGAPAVIVNAQTDANPYQIANELSWVLWQAAA